MTAASRFTHSRSGDILYIFFFQFLQYPWADIWLGQQFGLHHPGHLDFPLVHWWFWHHVLNDDTKMVFALGQLYIGVLDFTPKGNVGSPPDSKWIRTLWRLAVALAFFLARKIWVAYSLMVMLYCASWCTFDSPYLPWCGSQQASTEFVWYEQ